MEYSGPLKLVYFASAVAFPPSHHEAMTGPERAAGWDVPSSGDGQDPTPFEFYRFSDGTVQIKHKSTGLSTFVERASVKSWTPAIPTKPELQYAEAIDAPLPMPTVAEAITAIETPKAKAVTKRGNREFDVDDD